MELDESQVREMFDEDWSTGIVTLRPSETELIIDTPTIFEAFLTASENEGEGRIFFNYEMDGGIYNRQAGKPTPREAIPRASDVDFDGYTKRITEYLEGRKFCLRLVDLQVYDAKIFDRFGAVLRPLYEKMARLDTMSRGLQAVVFVGNYDFSPFGAHCDPYPQFQYVVQGKRKAHIWMDPEVWESRSHEDTLRPWEQLDSAKTWEQGAGDLFYWPTGSYHVFHCEGLAVAITVSFSETPVPTSDAERRARHSAHYFKVFPPTRRVDALRSGDRLQRPSASLPEIVRASPTETICVANGHIVSVDGQVSLDRLLARAEAGGVFFVRDAVADLRNERISEESALDLIRALVAARGLDLVST